MSSRYSPRTGRIISRLLTLGAVVAMIAGVVMIGHPFYTDYQAGKTQERLTKDLQTASVRQNFEQDSIEEYSPVTRLRIPTLGVDTIVVEGTSKEALDSGAGHYPTSPLPGQEGNVAIAGHRTTYGKPFADLDLLKTGDQVILDTPIGPFVYEMVPGFDGHANPWVIQPNDWTVIDKTSEPMLTLTTCHPKRSAAQRLVARLKLVETPSKRIPDGSPTTRIHFGRPTLTSVADVLESPAVIR